MNTYNFNDNSFKNTNIYKSFINDYPVWGRLRIRVYTASEAIPIKNLRVIISKDIDDNHIIFFDGLTNESGLIEKILLPAPKLNISNMDIPNKVTYDVLVNNNIYKVDIFEDVCVVQDINIVPEVGGL